MKGRSEAGPVGPHVVRLVTARTVLGELRRGGPLTVTDLVELTGLTRATVIAVCEDLTRRGWAEELDPDRSGPQRGRPPRTFDFRAAAGVVVGLDVGAHKTTALVADLRGRLLGTASRGLPRGARTAEARLDRVSGAALAALGSAGAGPESVLAVGAGVAAPVDREGRVAEGSSFWEMFDVGLAEALLERHGWHVLLENDANLAALAEQWRGAAQGVDDVAVLLAGERLGAGLIESGRLLRGRSGGAGELAFLALVDGAAGPHGIAPLARAWGAEAAAAPGGLARLAPSDVTAEAVFAAADDGDPAAVRVLARLAGRMARVVAVLSTLLNPELVVLGGAVAPATARLLPQIRAELPLLTNTPARVEVSSLGGEAVALGAVRRALDDVAERALEIELPGAPSTGSPGHI
ncbi:ROK family transcriptional regulator [Sinomonas sp. JGH33]|uniref:ROK family transcriptional regulator n=1 Tax=Sinomonas terricola TaxID=3110330 RepID=A0ABU5T232_9MICC|nr:ROK family transcriptional regulator [Sinomonas sp. JGH33]MEA5453551.1 ROK family transcriptional regulator [Sinomonas sp. JGH33]